MKTSRLYALVTFIAAFLLISSIPVHAQSATYFQQYGAGGSYSRSQWTGQVGMLWYSTDLGYFTVFTDSVYRPVNWNVPQYAPVDTLRAWDFTVPIAKSVFPVTTASRNVHATLPSATGNAGHVVTVFARAGTDSLFVIGNLAGKAPDTLLVGHAAYNSATLVATDSTWQVISTH